MKLYWLSPPDGTRWLTPDEVAGRWAGAFVRVTPQAEVARERGDQFIRTYQRMTDAGLAPHATPMAAVRRRWAGAVALDVATDTDQLSFRAIVCVEHRIELEFARSVLGRNRRGIARTAADLLGYRLESVDGD